jgi:hypothetical protein
MPLSDLNKRASLTALQFFSVFSAFALAFWYGTKEIAEGHADNVGTIVM